MTLLLGSVSLRWSQFVVEVVESIWLNNVQCQGNESSIINCSHSNLGAFCDSYHYGGVQCVGKHRN